MEPPRKRIKTAPSANSPSYSSSSETYNSDHPGQVDDRHQAQVAFPTRTINLSDFHRRSIFDGYEQNAGSRKSRRGAGIYMLPRAPQATVTTNVIEISVNDGNSVSHTTEIAAQTTATEVEISSLGTLTVPGVSGTVSSISSAVSAASSALVTSLPPSSSSLSLSNTVTTSHSTSLTSVSTIASGALNGTLTTGASTSNDRTVTVTSTRTFDVSYHNGTFITSSTLGSTSTHTSFVSDFTGDTDSADSGTVTGTAKFGDGVTITSLETTPTPTGFNPLGAGTIAATTSSSSPATSSSNTGDTPITPVLTPAQQQVVGGVVGGVAGIALVLVILLYVLKLYRQRLKSRGKLPEQIAAGRGFGDHDPHAFPPVATIHSHQSSLVPINALSSALQRFRPHSSYTMATSTSGTLSVNGTISEKGFQRIAGRKIAPVLSNGGDGYGGDFGAFEKEVSSPPSENFPISKHDFADGSFPHGSTGYYEENGRPASISEPSTPTVTSFLDLPTNRLHSSGIGRSSFSTIDGSTIASPDLNKNLHGSRSQMSLRSDNNNNNNNNNAIISTLLPATTRPEGYAMMRSSPARTPITQSPSSSYFRLPVHAPITMDYNTPEMPSNPNMGLGLGGLNRDGLGRSLSVEQQRSRLSARSASSSGRFRENME